MRTPFNSAGIVAASVGIALGLAAAGCTTSDEYSVSAGKSAARPQAPVPSLYPPIQADAADGAVHVYY